MKTTIILPAFPLSILFYLWLLMAGAGCTSPDREAPHTLSPKTSALIDSLEETITTSIQEHPSYKGLKLQRAVMSLSIHEQEPLGEGQWFSVSMENFYCFSEVRLPPGEFRKLLHTWRHNGQVVHTETLNVAGPRYRTYSAYKADPHQTGE